MPNPMRIVIDTRMIGHPLHGIARHARALIREFEQMDTAHRFTLLVNDSTLLPRTRFRRHMIRSSWLSPTEQIEIPLVLKKLNADLFHSPSLSIPFFCPTPFVITVHDMNHLACQENKKLLQTAYYHTILRRALKRASCVITVSHFSKSEILKYFDIDPKKIRVIYNGLDDHFYPIDNRKDLVRIQHKYGLADRFILYVGSEKKHKNADRMIAAYLTLETDLPLVMLGISTPRVEHSRVRGLPRVDDRDLPSLYTLCTCVVFPSLYEGFGFPAIEALACAKPLITSNTTSLPEVVDNHALLIDPTSEEALRSALTRLLRNPNPNPDGAGGIAQAKKFSWKTAARQTLEIYER